MHVLLSTFYEVLGIALINSFATPQLVS